MDRNTFEGLLHEEEGDTLDFKERQYRFANANEEEKSELLKDILGFANAWRRTDAYILIGVRDMRGGRAEVVGIPESEHLDDHSLQQFVNSRTNRPIRFHYAAFGVDGKQVGIIRVEQQIRPFFLKKSYGKLHKGAVYVRRGSCTDITRAADPDEVAAMGAGPSLETAEIVVEFADTGRDATLGTGITCERELSELPPEHAIPDLEPPRSSWPGGLSFGLHERPNREFFRELAAHIRAERLFQPMRLAIRNTGKVVAKRVRIELTLSNAMDAELRTESDMPRVPCRLINTLDLSPISELRSAFRTHPGELSIDEEDDRYRIVVECDDLQPGRRIYSDPFYAAKLSTGEVTLTGQVFSDNLPTPKDLVLTIHVTVSHSRLPLDQLLRA